MAEVPRAVAEVVIRLDVEDRRIATWTCTPERLGALAVGRLVSAGYVRDAADVLGVEAVEEADGTVRVRVRLTAEARTRGETERDHRRQQGCGLMHGLRCDPPVLGAATRRTGLPSLSVFVDLFRDLYAADDEEGGRGQHAAALSDGSTLRYRVQEVGRHNAVDKVIGEALLAGERLEGLGLVVSARISGEIAFKAARAGLGWIASRSIPTTLAVRLAEAAALPLIARAPSKSPCVYAASAVAERP